ncbi:unnamed protein product [Blepharisma stoltei]|uniref:Protein TIC 214 n=1 Tax=Blepharisma stoltei TaxID=1481888 RepID=A0AAU9J2F9_9CILI|nr:unnamed protein product [Blepharisma stoltei]
MISLADHEQTKKSEIIFETQEATPYPLIQKFNNTIEGSLIEYLSHHGPSSLSSLEEFITSKTNILRNPKGRKYSQNLEVLTISALKSYNRLFFLDDSNKWNLINENLMNFQKNQIEIIEKQLKIKYNRTKKCKEKRKKITKTIENSPFEYLSKLEEILDLGDSKSLKIIEFIEAKYKDYLNNLPKE